MRLVTLLCLTLGLCALAEPAKKTKRWKCTFQGRVVFCDLADRPLLDQRDARDRVFLLARTAPTFGSVVSAPATFREQP